MAPEGFPELAEDGGAALAQRLLPSDRLPGDRLLTPPETEGEAKSLDEVDPELLRTYEKLGIPPGTGTPRRVAVDASFDSVSVATTFKGKVEELGIILLLLRGGAGTPRPRPEISRPVSLPPTIFSPP